MATWTFRAGAALASLVFLSGCLDGVMSPSGPAPDLSIRVAGGDVTLAGPDGYCVDQGASRPQAARAFVVLGSCAAISGRPTDAHPDSPALLTATVADGPSAGVGDNIETLEAFLASDQGRAALARDGRAESVTVLRTERGDGVLYLFLSDRSSALLPGTQDRYWRGIFDLNGQLVTLSVISVSDRPISEATGLMLLQTFEARVRQASAPEAPAVDLPATDSPQLMSGLLGRLLR